MIEEIDQRKREKLW